MKDKNNSTTISDQELLVKIKDNSDNLGIVYKQCKTYCINFMRKMTCGKMNDYELEDVFQDAVIILYEKIVKDDFVLTASFQVYLNSVCRFQLLNLIAKNKLNVAFEENNDIDGNDENPMSYKSSITDVLDEIPDSKEAQFGALETALEKIKVAGGHCYELLTLFWYHKKSHEEIAQIMNYSNDKTSKKQKSGCQEKLRKMAFNELNH